MSFRKVPVPQTRARDQLRDIEDRLAKLERGGATAGQASFGPSIIIGGAALAVSVVVADTGGGGKTVTFKNLATGSTSVINLP